MESKIIHDVCWVLKEVTEHVHDEVVTACLCGWHPSLYVFLVKCSHAVACWYTSSVNGSATNELIVRRQFSCITVKSEVVLLHHLVVLCQCLFLGMSFSCCFVPFWACMLESVVQWVICIIIRFVPLNVVVMTLMMMVVMTVMIKLQGQMLAATCCRAVMHGSFGLNL